MSWGEVPHCRLGLWVDHRILVLLKNKPLPQTPFFPNGARWPEWHIGEPGTLGQTEQSGTPLPC
jgi:hypothetical protein